MEGLTRGNGAEAQKVSKMGGKESRRVDSLGWITESTVMPRKRREINGVGAGSIVDLRAELYRSQEEVKKVKEGGDPDLQRSRRKLPTPDVFSRKNSGVEDRAGRDKLHFKTENDGSASYAALERKAELYDRLVRGEVPIEDEEKYNVLFYRKGTLEDESQEMDSERRGEVRSITASFGEINPGISEKPPVVLTSTGLSQEQKMIIKEVNEATMQEREKVSDLKQRREDIASKKREQLRIAYLKKKKMEAARKAAQLQAPGEGTPAGTDATTKLESSEAA